MEPHEERLDASRLLSKVRFDADGLVPAVAQSSDTGEVLMLAYMNRAALEETIATGRVCYWSRSRQRPWRKGESSGHRARACQLLASDEGALTPIAQPREIMEPTTGFEPVTC